MTDFSTIPADLPIPEDDGAAAHLIGLKVPSIELVATSGATVRLDELGPGRNVIYLYPLSGRPGVDLPDGWDDIPGARGCTTEACSFRDHHQELLDAGASHVYGISSQDTGYQQELVGRLRLSFEILSDPDFALAQALTLPTFEADGLTLYKRLTLIVSGDTIEHVFYPIFPPNEHAEQVLNWLRDH